MASEVEVASVEQEDTWLLAEEEVPEALEEVPVEEQEIVVVASVVASVEGQKRLIQQQLCRRGEEGG